MQTMNASYSGQTRANGLRHGQGTYRFRNTFFEYEGDWVEGVAHGQGCFKLGKDGTSISGDFVDGEITGNGLKTWSNGAKYSGGFLLGEMHGQGTWIGPDGERYEGDFESNKRHGNGELVDEHGNRFIGEFQANRKHGAGQLVCANGDQYVGQWTHGFRCGHGTASWGNGDSYTGAWFKDMRHGVGEFVDGVSGLEYAGEWANDMPAVMPTRLKVVVDSGKPVERGKGGGKEGKEDVAAGKEKDDEKEEEEEEEESDSLESDLDHQRKLLVTLEAADKVQCKAGASVSPAMVVGVVHVEVETAIVDTDDLAEEDQSRADGKKDSNRKSKSKRKSTPPEEAPPEPQTKQVEHAMSQESGRVLVLRVLKEARATVSENDGEVECIPFVMLDPEEDLPADPVEEDKLTTEVKLRTRNGVAQVGRLWVNAGSAGTYTVELADETPALENHERLEAVELAFVVDK